MKTLIVSAALVAGAGFTTFNIDELPIEGPVLGLSICDLPFVRCDDEDDCGQQLCKDP